MTYRLGIVSPRESRRRLDRQHHGRTARSVKACLRKWNSNSALRRPLVASVPIRDVCYHLQAVLPVVQKSEKTFTYFS